MVPIPDRDGIVTRYIAELGTGFGRGDHLREILVAHQEGRIVSKRGEIFSKVYGLSGADGFSLESSLSVHLPSAYLDELSPVTEYGIKKSDHTRQLAMLGMSMKLTEPHIVKMRQIKSGKEIELKMSTVDISDIGARKVVGALMLLDPSAWDLIRGSGLILLRDAGNWANRRVRLDEVALPIQGGYLEVAEFDQKLSYEKSKLWEQLGPPVVIFQG